MKRISLVLALLIASTAGTILAVELTLRVLPTTTPPPRRVAAGIGQRDTPHFVVDPIVGWRVRPNHVIEWRTPEYTARARSNAQGFRGRDFDPAHRPIVVVGDSFSFGNGVGDEQTYATQLGLALGVPVYNLAVPGFGIDQIWITLRHVALPLKPRLVIVGVVEVDFDRSLTTYDPGKTGARPSFALQRGFLRPRTAADTAGWLATTLQQRSRTWPLVQAGLRALAYHLPVTEWWAVNAAMLARMHEDCMLARVPVLFVRIPTSEWRTFPGLRRFFAAAGADYLDLRAGTEREEAEGWYYPNDGHLNAAGHAYVAGRISARLAAAKLSVSPRAD
jgi:hypothetical protein